ncbi:type II toxin-antitoxin system ParD family antitoxin [Roseibium sp. AS2]|uniref:type II toxin-antitoxin system ParD family antitoxin n=1 Tax=Roseibium sp. AS2 TaxID=3135781 RepID=UPI00317CD147
MAEKISITLPPNMLEAIKAQVAAGNFSSTSEVLREAMRLWMRQEKEHEERMDAIRARIQHSLNDPRPNLTGKQVSKRLEALYDKHGV